MKRNHRYLAFALLLAPALCLAEAGDTAVVEMFKCTVNEGKTAADVQAHNAKWLAFVRQTNAEINSYGMQSIVGASGSFVFADVYPDLQAWSAAKTALDSEAGQAMEQGFAELLDCSENRLFKSTEH